MKRFFLIDTISGRASNEDSEAQFHEKFTEVKYIKSIEVQIQLEPETENSDGSNRISIPLILLQYGTWNVNTSNALPTNSDGSFNCNVNFQFKVNFLKKANLKVFQILLPILLSISFFTALLQTFFFKVRQQKLEYDFRVLVNFVINIFAHSSNALCVYTLSWIFYVFFTYKTQKDHVKILFPLEDDEDMIRIWLSLALVFKVSLNYL